MTPKALGRLSHNLTNLVGLVGSVSYSYENSYILNANMRIDASNKFGDASTTGCYRPGPYPVAGTCMKTF